MDILLGGRTWVDSMISLAVYPNWRRRSQSQCPLVTRKLLLEMLSKVRGTATPLEIRDPGLFIKESFFPLVVLASFVSRTFCILNP